MADPQKVDLGEYQNTPPPGAPPVAGAGVPTFGETLGREVKAFGSAVNPINIAKGFYHAAADKETPEESKEFGKGFESSIGPVGRVIDRSIVQPVYHAGKFYKNLATATPDQRSAMESSMLDVAPEALGGAGGTVVAMRGVQSAANLAKNAGVGAGVLPTSTARVSPITDIVGENSGSGIALPFKSATAPVVRGVAKTTNFVKNNVPELLPEVVRPNLHAIPDVPDQFGLTTMQKQGVANPDVLRMQDQAAGNTGMRPVSAAEKIQNLPQRGVLKTPQDLGLKPVTPEVAAAADAKANAKVDLSDMANETRATLKPERPVQGQSPLTETPGSMGTAEGNRMKPVTKTDVSEAVDKSLDVKPIQNGVKVRDQFKNDSGMTEEAEPKETSSRAETQAFIDHGLSKAEGARLTKTLDQINNASFGEFASKNGVNMGQNVVSRGIVNRGLAMNRGAIIKDMLTRMSPKEVEAAANNYIGKK